VAGTNSSVLSFTSSETIFNDDSKDLDFRVESDGNANMLFVDGGLNKVGIGVVPVQGVLTIKSGGNTYATGNLVLEDTDSTSRTYITHVNGDLAITNNTSRDDLILDSSGNFKVATGNLVVGTAGKGIDFSAQTATSAGGASVTSELLDHYEEGTWTPTIVAGTASVNNTATYTKIGRLVTCQLDITYPSQTNNNDADVEGLPFTSANNVAEPGAAVFSNLHASNNLVGFNAKNNTRFRLQDGGGTSTTLTAMAGKVLRATVTYITAT